MRKIEALKRTATRLVKECEDVELPNALIRLLVDDLASALGLSTTEKRRHDAQKRRIEIA